MMRYPVQVGCEKLKGQHQFVGSPYFDTYPRAEQGRGCLVFGIRVFPLNPSDSV